jgi:hypothetical protein
MGKSIRTTSNTQTAINSTPATFKVGDAVLCPSLSSKPFVLTADPYAKRDNLTLDFESSYFYYDNNGYFVRANQKETDDHQPSLFQDTPANRQAVATLYNSGNPTQTSQRTVIDTTSADDTKVVLISSHDLSHIACDIYGAANTLHDVAQLLALIHRGKIEAHTAVSMARLADDAASTWSEILYEQLDALNEPLALTGYSKVGAE